MRRLKPHRLGMPGLVLMTDPDRLPDPEAAVRALPPGCGVVLREPDAGRRARLAERLAPLCRRRRVALLIAGDLALALKVGAAGVHWPEAALRRLGRAAGRRPHRHWMVTASAHSAAALRRAAGAGADAAFVSPVFATASHPGAPALGALRFARLARLAPIAVYALGGIDGRTARRLKGSAAAGFAAIGALIPPPHSRTPQ